eukprot:364047-Chlamydomonas_euryale.AAC.6
MDQLPTVVLFEGPPPGRQTGGWLLAVAGRHVPSDACSALETADGNTAGVLLPTLAACRLCDATCRLTCATAACVPCPCKNGLPCETAGRLPTGLRPGDAARPLRTGGGVPPAAVAGTAALQGWSCCGDASRPQPARPTDWLGELRRC